MSDERERCAVCGKVTFTTWSEARGAARYMARTITESRGIRPYWSKQCHAIHIGAINSERRKRIQRRKP